MNEIQPTTPAVVAVCVADIHLSPNPPLFRSNEPDWLEAQQRQLDELDQVSRQHKCPIIIAGDVFDKPQNPIWFVNWAIQHLPLCYAVPGQHDLMHHNYEDLKRTTYWTLVKAGRIINLVPNDPIEKWVKGKPIRMWGFPWGTPVASCSQPKDMIIEIAVCHQYCWKPGKGDYPGVEEKGRVKNLWKQLRGFDFAVFGDNHIGFIEKGKTTSICNCGTFYRRKRNEKGNWPSLTLLHSDNTVSSHNLDISKDKFLDDDQTNKVGEILFDELVVELNKTQGCNIEFQEALIQKCDEEKVSPEIRQVIMKVLETV